MTKLLNFLGDHVVISDVHGMFAKSPAWFEQNKQFSDAQSDRCQLSCMHLIAEWSFTYQSCDHSLWHMLLFTWRCLDGSCFDWCSCCYFFWRWTVNLFLCAEARPAASGVCADISPGCKDGFYSRSPAWYSLCACLHYVCSACNGSLAKW